MQPINCTVDGFADGTAHRQASPPIYNRYARTAAAAANDEGVRAVLRPLFTIAFLMDDIGAEHDAFGANAMLLSSASSKTAVATAYYLSRRKAHALLRSVSSASRPLPTQRSRAAWAATTRYWATAGGEKRSRATHQPCTSTSVATLCCGARFTSTSAKRCAIPARSVARIGKRLALLPARPAPSRSCSPRHTRRVLARLRRGVTGVLD